MSVILVIYLNSFIDLIREQLVQAASHVNEQHWVNINFTTKEQWL